MPFKDDIKVGIGLDASRFDRGLAKAEGGVAKFKASAMRSITSLAGGILSVGLVKNISEIGLAAGETASKFSAVFGPATAEMNRQLQELQKTIPATRMEMQDALSTFASMGEAFQMTKDDAKEFSVSMVEIAGDLASFHNLKLDEAFGKIRSAISGEFEPMKQLGIVINEARLKTKAFELGIYDNTGALNANQKALAAQALILQDMGAASGDAARTATSAANQFKFLRQELMDTATDIGTTLLPALTKLAGWMSDIIGLAKTGAESVGKFFGEAIYGSDSESKASGESASRKVAQKNLIDRGEFYGLRTQAQRQAAIDAEIERMEEVARLNRERWNTEKDINKEVEVRAEKEAEIASTIDTTKQSSMEYYQNAIKPLAELDAKRAEMAEAELENAAAISAEESNQLSIGEVRLQQFRMQADFQNQLVEMSKSISEELGVQRNIHAQSNDELLRQIELMEAQKKLLMRDAGAFGPQIGAAGDIQYHQGVSNLGESNFMRNWQYAILEGQSGRAGEELALRQKFQTLSGSGDLALLRSGFTPQQIMRMESMQAGGGISQSEQDREIFSEIKSSISDIRNTITKLDKGLGMGF